MKAIIPERTGLVRFVTGVVEQRHLGEEIILDAIDQAENEMWRNGIVAVGDICNNSLTIPQKKKRRLLYFNFIEASGFNPSLADERFEKAKNIFLQYQQALADPGSVFQGSIVPHAPYSVSEPLWEKIIQFPGNQTLTIHNQETAGENEWFESKSGDFSSLYNQMNIDASYFNPTGKTSLQSYLARFEKDQSLILVHNVHTSEADLVFSKSPLVNCKLYWCLCPNANLYISGSLPDPELMMKQDCEIVLGTDSLASNNQLSILEEIKTLRVHFPNIELETIMKWGTSNGAKALNQGHEFGSFDTGKRPGVVLISEDLNKSERLI